MLTPGNRNRLIGFAVLAVVVGFIGYQMFYALTPPRHADHDHAMASLDASGFLRIEARDGRQRNLVGRPGHVLILHFFDPRSPDLTEPREAAAFAASTDDDPGVEVLFVARADSWEGVEGWARAAGVPTGNLYLDKGGRTADLLGVRRWPETLIYDPQGLLVHQARGSLAWNDPALRAEIDRARAGVEEIE